MEHSKLPFRYWIAATFLLTGTKKSFSMEGLRHLLGHKRYQTIWEMSCKLRDVMGKRNERYLLIGQVEQGADFFTIEQPEDKRSELLKRGHGSQRKAEVLVMVENVQSEKDFKKGIPAKTVECLKMQVIPDLKSKIITDIVGEQLGP